MKARTLTEYLVSVATLEDSLRNLAWMLRRAKRQRPYPEKRLVVAKYRELCAARCTALGLPDDSADGTRQRLEEAIAQIHPERNRHE